MPGRDRSHSIELERHVVAEFQSGETCYALAGRRASIRDGRPGGLWFRQGCELADVARSCFYDKRELGPVLAPVASVSGSNRSSSAMIRRAEITLAPGYSTGRDALLHLPAKALSCRAPKRKNPAGKGGVPKQTSNDISRSVAVAHELIDVFLIEKCKALYQYSASALVCLKKTALKGVIPGEGRSMGEHAVKLANFWKCKLNPDFPGNFNAPRVQASRAGKSAGHTTPPSSMEPGNAVQTAVPGKGPPVGVSAGPLPFVRTRPTGTEQNHPSRGKGTATAETRR